MKHLFKTLFWSCLLIYAQQLVAQSDIQKLTGSIPSSGHLIGEARDITLSSGIFYDAGGWSGNAGDTYAISTLHASSDCLEVFFTEFNLPEGSELRVYLGKDASAPLFGRFRKGDKIWNIKAPHITFEYIPSSLSAVTGRGWKAIVSEVSCASAPKTTWPESDCPYAIPLCANTTIITGLEQYTDLGVVDDDDGSCYGGTGQGGSVWYSFSPQAAGLLDFTITPTSTTDYDFVLWDITDGCGDGQRDQISCNYSLYSGPTGLSDTHCSDAEGDDTPTGNCGTDSKGSSYNRWNRRVSVDPSHTYALCVNFYSGSNHGFQLTFTNEAGSVGILDNTAPEIANTSPNSCTSATLVHVDFSEWISCASIGDHANEFSIPGYTVSVSNMYCINGRTNHVDLTVSPNLPTGDYTLTITNITDICGNVMNDNMIIHIGVPVANAGADQVVCESRVINLLGWYDYTYNPGSNTLTASGGGTYTWNTGSSAQTINVEPTSTTNYTVTATIGGCTSSDAVTVNVSGVNAGPDRSVCVGQSTTLTASAGCSSYTWYKNPSALLGTNGTQIGTSQSVIVNPTANTVYRVVGTTALGCSSTWDLRVTVLSANVPVTIGNAICQGSGGGTILTGSGYDNYTWNPGGLTGSTVSVSPLVTTNYTVSASAASGCSGSNIVTVYVLPSPASTVTATPSSTCQGSNVSLSTTPPATINLFSEDFESTNKLFLKNPPNCGLFSGNSNKWYRGTSSQCGGSYSLYISDDNSGYGYNAMCSSVSHAYFDVTIPSCYTGVSLSFSYKCDGDATDKMQVWCTPSLFVPAANTKIDTSSGGVMLGSMYNISGCTTATYNLTPYAGQTRRIIFQWNNENLFGGDDPALIDNIAVTATPSYSYSWSSSPAGFTSTTQNPTANPSVNTTYTVNITRCDGCTSSASAGVTIAPVTVTASAADPNLCTGESTTLNAGGASSYTWNPGGLSGSSVTVTPGSTMTYTVTGTSGSCSASNTVTVNVSSPENATITPAGPFCADAASVNLTAATGGGTWTGTGITNGTTGTFNPVTAGVGTHLITYTISTGCGGTDTAMIQVTAAADASITPAGPFCAASSPVTLSAANGGGTWTGTGITNATLGTFSPSAAGAGNHQIIYSIPGSCGDADTLTINVLAQPDATINPAGPFCADGLATTLNAATSGGTWSGTGITNSSLGVFDPVTAGTGTHQIIYTLSGSCAAADTIMLLVTAAADATITPSGPYCVTDSPVTLVAANNGGTWTGAGITNGTVGTFSPATAGSGNHQIIYNIPGSCGDADTISLVVSATANAQINSPGILCVAGAPVNLTAATAGGSWAGNGITDASLGTFDPASAGTGSHQIIYTIGGFCGGADTLNITVTGIADASITPAGPFCESASPVNLSAATPGGTWTGSGITNGMLGTFNPSTAGEGTHQIIYTISGACGNADTLLITVNASANATINNSGPYCIYDSPITLTAAQTGGVWSGSGITDSVAGTFNPATAGAGSHTIVYTISGTCGDTDSITITVTSQLDATIDAVGEVCSNVPSFNLSAADSGGTWSGAGIANTSTGTFSAALAGAGTHQIIYTISGSCGDADTLEITVNQAPALNTGSNPATCIDSTNGYAFFSVTGGLPPYVVNWNNGATSDTIRDLAPGNYTVLITDTKGCSVTSQITVSGSSEACETLPLVIYVPNIFSPNNDQINDVLYVRGQGVKELNFIVYDRWGEKIFETTDLNLGWDGTFRGKPMESAVYVWYLNAKGYNDENINQKGSVTLVK